jgi:hypothetical protein
MKTLVTGILLGQKREKTGERERERKSLKITIRQDLNLSFSFRKRLYTMVLLTTSLEYFLRVVQHSKLIFIFAYINYIYHLKILS